MKTVITHNGIFHADEVVAIALLRIAGFSMLNIVRTRDKAEIKKGIENPYTFVIDVGGIHDPSKNNFDHHQDKNLPSAAGLVYEHFKDQICDKYSQQFFSKFIASIDAIDTNRNDIYKTWNTLPDGFRNTSNIISGFNRDPKDDDDQHSQFELALTFATFIIRNELHLAGEKAKSEAMYTSRTILPNNVAVFDEFNTVWKEKPDHQFAVMPHTSGWQIVSRDTSVAIVPESVSSCDGFIFRHASGFMATVKEKSTAVEFAKTL